MALVGSWACAENRRSKNPDRRVIARPGGLPGPRKSRARLGARRIADEHRWPERRPDRSAHCRARSPRRRDRGARHASRRRHCAASRPHPRIRRPWRLGPRLPVVRPLALLARRARAGRRARARPRGACARIATPAEGGPRARRAVVLEGPRADAGRDAETEERLVAVGRAGTAEHVELIVRGWRRMDRKAEAQETTRRHRNRALHVYPDGDGMVVIRGRLEPEVGAVVMQALTAAREALSRRRRAEDVPAGTSIVGGSAEPPTMEQQQADALALVAVAALHRGMDPGAPDADAPGQSVL